MVPELGHFALLLALCLTVLLALLPLAGTITGSRVLMASCHSLSAGVLVFTTIAFLCLCWAFLQDDFSVKYVANHSNTLLPVQYKISAVWGGHEGSLLLWVLTLALWTYAVSVFSKNLPLDMLARVLSVMGMIGVGFLLFTLLTSNPFDRYLPHHPAEGSDLNPLLQDFGLIVHPPMLYMGYVGFSVAFAFAIAALLSGRLDTAWARWSRPWTTIAWAFLTLGISLGSWWAYYELGWGGWWFWDPVENASFMPWLVGTALIHSLAATEKRGVFKSWTILLAIFAFSLSLLGTFLVRSGVLTSVHAFANDPERGVFILGFLALVVGASLTLYALRAPVVKSVVGFNLLSRESFLLINNIVLVIVTATVLLGTLYPLIADALEWGKVSVGPPFFNLFFVPLMGVLSVLIGIGVMLNWKRSRFDQLLRWLSPPALLALLTGAVFPWLYAGEFSLGAATAVAVGSWVTFSMFADLYRKVRHADSIGAGLRKLRLSYYGMFSAHIGVAITLIGVILNTIYSDQRDLRMEAKQSVEVGDYRFELDRLEKVRGPNYIADQATIYVFDGERQVATLQPQKRRYLASGDVMTEAGIDAGLMRDIYVSMGEPLSGNAWAVSVHDKPFVRWIWLGTIFMSIGGVLAVSDKRYRIRRRTPADDRAAAGDGGAVAGDGKTAAEGA